MGTRGFAFILFVSISISPIRAQTPPNDRCPTALPISPLGQTLTGNTLGAADDEAASCVGGSGGRDVVFRFQLTQPMNLVADTVGSSFDTVLSIWTGCTVSGLTTELLCNDDFEGVTSRLDLPGIPAGFYYILLDGFDASQAGDFALNFGPATEPPNNRCDDAAPLTVGTSVYGSTLGATHSESLLIPGLPSDGADVFYNFVASATEMQVDTFGSQFDTVLAVRPAGCSGDPIASNDDADGTPFSRVDLSGLTIGSDYAVQVDSASTTGGAFKLTLVETQPPPDGNECQDLFASLAIPSQTMGSTFFATDDATPEVGAGAGPDVAFKVSVIEGTNLVLDTLGSDFDTILYVRSGSCAGAQVGFNDDFLGGKTSRIALESLAAGDYFVFVDGKSVTDRGDFVLNLAEGAPPPNDDCAGALPIDIPSTQVGSTQFATNGTSGSCGGDDAEVAFRFTLAEPTRVIFDTVGSDFDTVLYLRTGACGAETDLTCDDDSVGTLSRINDYRETPLDAGDYTIYVDGAGDFGTFTLNAIVVGDIEGDLNGDGFVNAVDLLSAVEQHRTDTIDPEASADLDSNTFLDGLDAFLFTTDWFMGVPPP
jgi:hypothetical protein